MKRKIGLILLFLCMISTSLWAVEYSDTSRFVQGFTEILTAPFYLPMDVLQKTFSQFPPVGAVEGALTGTYRTVTTLMKGLFDMAGAAAPYAKYAFPFI